MGNCCGKRDNERKHLLEPDDLDKEPHATAAPPSRKGEIQQKMREHEPEITKPKKAATPPSEKSSHSAAPSITATVDSTTAPHNSHNSHKRDEQFESPHASHKKPRISVEIEPLVCVVHSQEKRDSIDPTPSHEVQEPVVVTPSTSVVQEVSEPSTMEELEDYPLYKATYDYNATADHELSMNKGDIILYYNEEHEKWYRGQNKRTMFSGWFPSNYVENTGEVERLPRIINSEEADNEEEEEQSRHMSVDMSKRSSRIKALQRELAKAKTQDEVFTEQ